MIIVTGGAGFIGSNLIRALNRRGHADIVVVDDLTRGDKYRNLASLDIADYLDKRDFISHCARHVVPGLRAVFHLGACTDTTASDGRYLMENNYRFSAQLLDACQHADVPFIYASSASVYGDGQAGFREERSCERPLNAYAYSKFQFDQLVRRRLPNAGAQIVGLRYFNVYGPQENHKGRMATVVYQFHRQLQRQGVLELFAGSEGFRRDFIHVDDIVALNCFFLDHPLTSGILNAGTGRAESFARIAELMLPYYPGARIATKPFPDDLKGKYQAYTCADLTRLHAAGYTQPFIDCAAGVAAYVAVLRATEGYYP